MRVAPRVLLITNEATRGDASGQIDGYTLLESTCELSRVDAVSARAGFEADPEHAIARVLEAIDQSRPDIAVVWTPGRFPGSREAFDRIMRALGTAQIVYWEGDPWHRGKPMTEQMSWWMTEASVVFSTAGPPQATAYLAAGAGEVRHVANTYCHIKFGLCEKDPPPPVESNRVTMIGINLMRIPGLTGVPGSVRRAELAIRLNGRLGDFDLRGRGWRRFGMEAAPLPYELQADHIRQGALSVVWDHWPYLPDYASDRLPIALIAGRAHVTTRHPGMAWAPSEQQGLFQRSSPREIVEVVEDLLADRDRLSCLGRKAHDWAKHRVSHREAARYILSSVVESVAPPPADPWGSLPGPWTKLG